MESPFHFRRKVDHHCKYDLNSKFRQTKLSGWIQRDQSCGEQKDVLACSLCLHGGDGL